MSQDIIRHIRPGTIDVHPTDLAIVVEYEIEACVLNEYGEEVVSEVKESQKIIRVPKLTPKSNIPALAGSIIDKCKYVHPDMQPELEQLLRYLQTRGVVHVKQGNATDKRTLQTHQDDDIDGGIKAVLNELDSYIEHLYGNEDQRIEGTSLILQLARYPDNLGELARNQTLLNVLTRLLRDDMTNLSICTNVISIFFFFSSYIDFHEMLAYYKIGSTCMSIVEQEIKRYNEWQARKKKLQKRVTQGKSTEKDVQAHEKKIDDKQFRQETLLFVTFHLLLNVAVDPRVEHKMTRKNLIPQLVCLLQRSNIDFLTLMLKFLKKLSIYEENKNEMLELGVVAVVLPHVPHESPELLAEAVSLLFNLSFDPTARQMMLSNGIIEKYAETLAVPLPETPVETMISTLYHLTIDESNRQLFAKSEIVPLVMKLLLSDSEQPAPLDALALGVNLALEKSNAIRICQGPGTQLLIKQALRTRDALMLKMVRNATQHDETKETLLDSLADIASEIPRCVESEVLVELVGLIGNLEIPEMNFEQLAQEYRLVPFAHRILSDMEIPDDLLLEVIVMVGTLLIDPDCAPIIAESGIVEDMIALIQEKQDDDELVLQIVYVWTKLLHFDSTRRKLLRQAKAIAYLVDLMNDKNQKIKNIVGSALDIVMEHNEQWAAEIRMKRFCFHNAQWNDMFLQGEELPPQTPDEFQRREVSYDDYYYNEDQVRFSNKDLNFGQIMTGFNGDEDLVEFDASDDDSDPHEGF